MGQFKKKPALIEATQWFRNGDHPKDESKPIDSEKWSEGKVVKEFRALHIPGDRMCTECGHIMRMHGLIPEDLTTTRGEEIVHVGSYVVTEGRTGRYYVVPAEEFEAMYEPY